MKQRVKTLGAFFLAAAGAVIGFFFRSMQLSGHSRLPLIALSVLLTLLFILAAAALEQEKRFEAVLKPGRLPAIFGVLGGLCMAAGCAAGLSSGTLFSKAVAMLGILSGICAAAAGILRKTDQRRQLVFYVVIQIFFIVRLFSDFRRWEVDPAVLDYCFMLFAAISFMLTAYQAGAFCFDRGSRRLLAFFSMTGVLFGAVSAAGADVPTILYYGGGAVWLLTFVEDTTKE